MEEKHRRIIADNASALAEYTNLKYLIPALVEKKVFTQKMIDIQQYLMVDTGSKKFTLFDDVQRRGPHAFSSLVEAFIEIGSFEAARLLDPENSKIPVANVQYVSLAKKTRRLKQTTSERPPVHPPPIQYIPQHKPSEIVDIGKGNLKPMDIQVVKAAQFGISPDPKIACYSMRSKKRGIFFMINNIDFGGKEKPRNGAVVDEINLEKLFREIGFHEIIIKRNLTKDGMEAALLEFATSNSLEETDCVFIVIGSHGMFNASNFMEYIKGTDGRCIATHTIEDMFKNKNSYRLQNIPKVIIFQTCRGEDFDLGQPEVVNESFEKRTESDGSVDKGGRTYSDLVIVHSTLPGLVSQRDIYDGSWYITSLCEIFMKHAHETHLEDLFKLVDHHLKDTKKEILQTSSLKKYAFNKYLYLNPGLFE